MSAWTDRGDSAPIGNPADARFLGTAVVVMAGSLIVFFRRNIGLRLLTRRKFLITFGLLMCLADIETPFDWSLACFAVAFTALVFIHHARHIQRIHRGMPEWHTYSTGEPLICSLLPLPRPVVRVVIEPMLCTALGWWLMERSNANFYVGLWIMTAGVTLFFLENDIRKARHERFLDLGDTFVESEDFARRAEQFTKQRTNATARSQQGQRGVFWDVLLRVLKWASEAAEKQKQRQQAQDRRRQDEQRQREEQRRQQEHQRQQEEAAAHERQQQEEQARRREMPSGKMTAGQALEILGLKAGATEQEIRAAYNRLMQKVHPDVGGSNFFAKQLNVARDVLLARHKR